MYKLPKKHILRKNSGFQAVYSTGKSYANRMMVLYVLPKDDGPRRIGFAAGKRLGNAVVRNRVKRLMRETYRLNQDKLAGGVDLIIIGRQPIVNAKQPDIVKAFLSLCQKANIIIKKQSSC